MSKQTNTLSSAERKAWEKILKIDFEPIVFKLVKDPDSGINWAVEEADKGINEYRKYLFLFWKYKADKTVIIAPSKFVDKVWHQHALDTSKYRDDCEAVFATPFQKMICSLLRWLFKPLKIQVTAGFMDHFPYLGMRSEQDAQLLEDSFASTNNLLEQHFSAG